MVCFQPDKYELVFCSRVRFFSFQLSGFVVWCLHRDKNRAENQDLKKCQHHKERRMKAEDCYIIKVSIPVCEHVAGQSVTRK